MAQASLMGQTTLHVGNWCDRNGHQEACDSTMETRATSGLGMG